MLTQAGARDRPGEIDLHQCDRLFRSQTCASRRANWRNSRATSCRPIRNSIRTLPSANSPGTTSASRTAIRCLHGDWRRRAQDRRNVGSGFNLVGSAVQDDFRLIVVVTGARSEKERADEARKMLEWGFHGFEARVLFAEGQTIGEAKVFGGDRSYVPLVGPGTIRLMMPRNGSERLIARIVYSGPVPAPVSKGQSIGKLKVWRGDNLALEVPLKAADDVGKGSMSQRARWMGQPSS